MWSGCTVHLDEIVVMRHHSNSEHCGILSKRIVVGKCSAAEHSADVCKVLGSNPSTRKSQNLLLRLNWNRATLYYASYVIAHTHTHTILSTSKLIFYLAVYPSPASRGLCSATFVEALVQRLGPHRPILQKRDCMTCALGNTEAAAEHVRGD